MCHGRYRTQKTFRIDRTLMIDMLIAEHLQVGLRQNIDVGIVGIAVAQDKDQRVDDQQEGGDREDMTMIPEKGEQRYDAIAKGYTLHNGPDTQMTETQKIAFNSMIEPVDEKTDGKKQHRTFHNTSYYRSRGLKGRLRQGEIARHAHDEQEEWEHQITRRQTIPLRVLKHLERLVPAIVDQDHSCYGQTA